MPIELDKEQRDRLVSDIQYFFQKERDEDIGNLGADMLLDFFMKDIAPQIYNQALDDAKTWFTGKLADLDVDYMLLEKENN